MSVALPVMARGVCVTAATMTGLLGRTVALATGAASLCDVFEYYDVRARECRHCDTACFEHENGTIVGFKETRCFQLCPGYIKEPRLPVYPKQQEERVTMTVMEGGLFGFIIALIIVCILVVILLRAEIAAALKRCFPFRKMLGGSSSRSDVSETSYVKLSDPSDEVEIVDRVTCV